MQGLQRAHLANGEKLHAFEVAEQSRARSLLALMLQSCEPPKTFDESSRHLRMDIDGSVLVYYSILADSSVAAWVFGADGVLRGCETLQLVLPEGARNLAGYVEAFRGDISLPVRGDPPMDFTESSESERASVTRRRLSLKHAKQHLASCYASLWAPLTKWIKPGESIVIVPDQDLYLLPFAALWDSEAGEYLIQRHELSLVPSISISGALKQGGTEMAEKSEALVMGVSTFQVNSDNPTLPPLSEVVSEVGSVRNQCVTADLKCDVLMDEQVSHHDVLKFLARPWRFVHFATHGLLDRGGALALHDKNLQIEDIGTLRLNAHVAVLSACSTARGNFSADGVIGLSRSFLAAGVPALLVSLWNVSDSSTRTFMHLFYEAWLVKGKQLTTAVRAAMCQMLSQGCAPHQWAAFTILGVEPRT